ncbi:MAG: hypothetical protein M0038_13960 [Pseudomonadota bacterium]|jgi:hypothetical protein|nr:hypothetical protein [Pseudomonadota bacterium]
MSKVPRGVDSSDSDAKPLPIVFRDASLSEQSGGDRGDNRCLV